MSTSLYWIQCGACGGDTMSLISMESPGFNELLTLLDINVLWHPSLSNHSSSEHQELLDKITSGEIELDILLVEGFIIRGPGGSGMYDTMNGIPKKNIVNTLAHKAKTVVAVGTCASFGGVGTDGEVGAIGMQFKKKERGGFLGKEFTSRSGLPVINLPGCPCHYHVIYGTLLALISDSPIPLNKYNMPHEWFGMLIHQGCTRNEYHEYRVEEHNFGEMGCLFFYLGCHGPLAYGPCNKILWHKRNSKTRAGVPCFGCTHPNFPHTYPFFNTKNIEGIPLYLPHGVDRAHYMAYKEIAAAAAPKRLLQRKTKI